MALQPAAILPMSMMHAPAGPAPQDQNATSPEKPRWVPSSKGMIPPRGIVGGNNHQGPIYVARLKLKNEEFWVPGKLIPHYGQCYVSVEGQEVSSRRYEVLCGCALSWLKTTSQAQIPTIAVKGGEDKLKAPLYIGRIAHGRSVTVGKVESTTRKCYVLYGGVEHAHDTYELLVHGTTGGTKATTYRPPPTGVVPSVAPKPEDNLKLVPLAVSDQDHINVCNKMLASLPNVKIIKIERVLNRILWKRFMHCRERIMQENNNNANERELFHGSGVCQQIIRKGFDERHANIGGAFGAGVYFADHAVRSSQFSQRIVASALPYVQPPGGALATGGGLEMMLCRVILGNMADNLGGMRAHAPPGYHSVRGNAPAMPEYVVYRGEQALPKFLITYQ